MHLTPERSTVAARIAPRPLHRRVYRVASRPGALHPPLARALVLLAGPGALLDPFCGTGTIPIEAELACAGRRVTRSDVDGAALGAARENAAAAGAGVALAVADAGRLPFGDAAFGGVATNPPWGLRVPAAGLLRVGFERFWGELARVVRPGGRVVVLVPPARPSPGGFTLVDRLPVRVSGAVADVWYSSGERGVAISARRPRAGARG